MSTELTLDPPDEDTEEIHNESSPLLPQSPSLESLSTSRWISLAAVVILFILAVILLTTRFIAPDIVHIYAAEALDLDICDVAIKSVDERGIVVATRSLIGFNVSKVHNPFVRIFSRLGTSTVVKAASVKSTSLSVYLHQNNSKLGSVTLPDLSVKVKDGYEQFLQFDSIVTPQDSQSIHSLFTNILEGNMNRLDVDVHAYIQVKAGILPYIQLDLSKHFVSENIAKIPKYQITQTSVTDSTKHTLGIEFAVSASVANPLHLTASIPRVPFSVLIPGCNPEKPIRIAKAFTHPVQIFSQSKVNFTIQGEINKFPEALTSPCKDTSISPIDYYLSSYLAGKYTKVLLEWDNNDHSPCWLKQIVQDLIVPIPLPNRTVHDLVHSINFTGVKLRLPTPNLPKNGRFPLLSGRIVIIIDFPEGVDLSLDIDRVQPDILLYDHNKAFARLAFEEWSHSSLERDKYGYGYLTVELTDIPMEIIDKPTFERFVRRVLFDPSEQFKLGVKGTSHLHIVSGILDFVIHKVPIEGNASIKSFASLFGNLDSFVKSLHIVDSTRDSLTMNVLVTMENPTEYSMSIPYLDVQFITNGSVIGNGTVTDVELKPGRNTFSTKAQWAPLAFGGSEAVRQASDFLSSYISGHTEYISLRFHKDSIPWMPDFGDALSNFQIRVPIPKILNDDKHFLDSATFHLLTSSVTFGLYNPFDTTPLIIKEMDGKAYYNGSLAGTLKYELPFAIDPACISQSPKLPVNLVPDGTGYRAIRDALGGNLTVDGQAIVNISIGACSLHLNITATNIDSQIRIF